MIFIDLYHSRLLLFIEISIKAPPLQHNVPILMQNLITFGEILPNDFKNVDTAFYTACFEGINQNFDLFLAKCSNFTISKVLWVEIIELLIISLSSLVTLTRLILVG